MGLSSFNHAWPRVGGLLGLIIAFIVLYQWFYSPDPDVLSLLYWLHLAILMFHEFEEYVFPGGFKEFFNTRSVFALPVPREDAPLGDGIIALINMVSWFLVLLGALLVKVVPWFGFMMIVGNSINVVAHLLVFQVRVRGYNPGLLSALFLQLPFIVFSFSFVIVNGVFSVFEWFYVVFGGLIVALLLPLSGVIAKKLSEKGLH